jgi:hypothetical protein
METGGNSVVVVSPVSVTAPVVASIENAEMVFAVWLPTYMNFPFGSITSNNGAPPAVNGELVIWVRTPVTGVTVNTEMLLDPKLATYRYWPKTATAVGVVPVAYVPSRVKAPLLELMDSTETVLSTEFAT